VTGEKKKGRKQRMKKEGTTFPGFFFPLQLQEAELPLTDTGC
jgi:hypothetical protein